MGQYFMHRRNFLKNSALALFGFSILPPAKTYERIWKAQRAPIMRTPFYSINPAWVNAPYEAVYYFGGRAKIIGRDQATDGNRLVPHPMRFVQEGGAFREVPTFVQCNRELPEDWLNERLTGTRHWRKPASQIDGIKKPGPPGPDQTFR